MTTRHNVLRVNTDKTCIPGKCNSHRGWRCHLQIHRLKDEVHLRRHLNNFPTHQTQLLVVIQHCVHVLDPHCIDWTIEDQPFPVRALMEKRGDFNFSL